MHSVRAGRHTQINSLTLTNCLKWKTVGFYVSYLESMMRGGNNVLTQVCSFSMKAIMFIQNIANVHIKQRWPYSVLLNIWFQKFGKCEAFHFLFFFKAAHKLFTVFYGKCSCFLWVYFRILLGQAQSALRNDRMGMVPSLFSKAPGKPHVALMSRLQFQAPLALKHQK